MRISRDCYDEPMVMVPHTPGLQQRITIDAVQRAVAGQFGLSVDRLKEKGNSHPIVVPRQIAMYLARELTQASFPQLGRHFGGKHHTTVLHAIQKIEGQRHADADLAAVLAKLESDLAGSSDF
jgi:chromosomal replication initiator protein